MAAEGKKQAAGTFIGKPHSEDGSPAGIPFKIGNTKVEIEGREMALSDDAMNSTKRLTLKGTAKQIIHYLNSLFTENYQPEQPVNALDGGEGIVREDAITDEKVYEVSGTPRMIASCLNENHDGVNFRNSNEPCTLKEVRGYAEGGATMQQDDIFAELGWAIDSNLTTKNEATEYGKKIAGAHNPAEVMDKLNRIGKYAEVDIVEDFYYKPLDIEQERFYDLGGGINACHAIENKEHKGIEIRFPQKPAIEILDGLKAKGFRWSKRGFWYTHFTKEKWDYAMSLCEKEAERIEEITTAPIRRINENTLTSSGKVPKNILRDEILSGKLEVSRYKRFDASDDSSRHILKNDRVWEDAAKWFREENMAKRLSWANSNYVNAIYYDKNDKIISWDDFEFRYKMPAGVSVSEPTGITAKELVDQIQKGGWQVSLFKKFVPLDDGFFQDVPEDKREWKDAKKEFETNKFFADEVKSATGAIKKAGDNYIIGSYELRHTYNRNAKIKKLKELMKATVDIEPNNDILIIKAQRNDLIIAAGTEDVYNTSAYGEKANKIGTLDEVIKAIEESGITEVDLLFASSVDDLLREQRQVKPDFSQFEKIVRESASPEAAYAAIREIKDVPAVTAQAFREKYDSAENQTPLQALTKFYHEIKGTAPVVDVASPTDAKATETFLNEARTGKIQSNVSAIKEEDKIVPKLTKASQLPKILRDFMPPHQLKAVTGLKTDELWSTIQELAKNITSIPLFYSSDEFTEKVRERFPDASLHDTVIVRAHFFIGGTDWYISEWDRANQELFGFTVLNGDYQMAALGYISLKELHELKSGISRVDLDFHFEPTTLSDALHRLNREYFPSPKHKDEILEMAGIVKGSEKKAMEPEKENIKSSTAQAEDAGEGNVSPEPAIQSGEANNISEQNTIEPVKEEPAALPAHAFKPGQRFYYTGDQANNSSFGTIVSAEAPTAYTQLRYKVTFDEARFQGDTKESTVDHINFAKGVGQRYKTIEQYNEEKAFHQKRLESTLSRIKEQEVKKEEAPVTVPTKTDSVPIDITYYKNPYDLNKAIEKLIEKKLNISSKEDWTALFAEQDARIPVFDANELVFMQNYTGYGGLQKYMNKTDAENPNWTYEFYTPKWLRSQMWGLALAHGFTSGSIIEPSCGIGGFFHDIPEHLRLPGNVVGYEINPYSAVVAKATFPFVHIVNEPFETLFIKKNQSIKGKIQDVPKFDLNIGNPPYGKFTSFYGGMGEQAYTHASNYIEYFITRGLDVLRPGGLLVFVIGAEVSAGGIPFLDSAPSKVKEIIASKIKSFKPIDFESIRLANGVFDRTDVLPDLIVMRKK